MQVSLQPSTWVFWLFANNNPAISAITSNKQWQNAVRYALDYKSIVSVAGPGAIPDAGNHPVDVRWMRCREGRGQAEPGEGQGGTAGVGRRQHSVTLEYPSDLTINGVPFTTLAQRVQSNLQAVGINVRCRARRRRTG